MKKSLLLLATVTIVVGLQTLRSMDTEEAEILGEQAMGMDVDMDVEDDGKGSEDE